MGTRRKVGHERNTPPKGPVRLSIVKRTTKATIIQNSVRDGVRNESRTSESSTTNPPRLTIRAARTASATVITSSVAATTRRIIAAHCMSHISARSCGAAVPCGPDTPRRAPGVTVAAWTTMRRRNPSWPLRVPVRHPPFEARSRPDSPWCSCCGWRPATSWSAACARSTAGSKRAAQDFQRGQDVLTTVRTNVLLGSIYLRDALIDRTPASQEDYRARAAADPRGSGPRAAALPPADRLAARTAALGRPPGGARATTGCRAIWRSSQTSR